MALNGRAVGFERIDAAATVRLQGENDPPRCGSSVGESQRQVQLRRGGVAVAAVGIADGQYQHRIARKLVETGTARCVAVVVRDHVTASRTAITEVQLAAGTGTASRTGHVGLVPLDDDGDELARIQRRNSHWQRRAGGGAGGVEIQQVFSSTRAAVRQGRKARSGILVGAGAIVASRGKVRHPLGLDRVHGLGQQSVLVERFIVVTRVIGFHLGARCGERQDAIGKVGLAVIGGIERETRPRGHVMDDLQHRAALIGERQVLRGTVVHAIPGRGHSIRRRVRIRLREHVHIGRQVAGRDIGGVIGKISGSKIAVVRIALVARGRDAIGGIHRVAVEAVGEHADRDAGASGIRISGTNDIATLGKIALRCHGAGAPVGHRRA